MDSQLNLVWSGNTKSRAEACATLARHVAFSSIAIGAFIPFICATALLNEMASALCHVPLFVFKHACVDLVPAIIMAFCFSGLFRNFFMPGPDRLMKLIVPALAGVAVLHFVSDGPLGLLSSLAGAALWYGSCRLGSAMRKAMPASFRFDYALVAATLGYLPATAFVVALVTGLWQAPNGMFPSAHAVSVITLTHLMLTTLTIGAMLSLPAFLVAKTARTNESKPLILLAVLLNSPMIMALAMMPAAALFASGIAPYALLYILACLPMPLAAAMLTAAGAWGGAKSNAVSHHLKVRRQKSSLKLDF